jgi:hypothetical protein
MGKDMERKNILKKGLTIVVILLFIGLAFAPNINANDFKVNKLARITIWIGVEYVFYYTYVHPDEDKWFIMIDWGDGNKSDWFGPFNSGDSISYLHYWTKTGNYAIKMRTKDEHGYISEWSDSLPISVIYPNRFFKNMEIAGTLKKIPIKGLLFCVLSFEKAEITKAISKKMQLDPFTCYNYKFISLFLKINSYNKVTKFINASVPFAILIDF